MVILSPLTYILYSTEEIVSSLSQTVFPLICWWLLGKKVDSVTQASQKLHFGLFRGWFIYRHHHFVPLQKSLHSTIFSRYMHWITEFKLWECLKRKLFQILKYTYLLPYLTLSDFQYVVSSVLSIRIRQYESAFFRKLASNYETIFKIQWDI